MERVDEEPFRRMPAAPSGGAYNEYFAIFFLVTQMLSNMHYQYGIECLERAYGKPNRWCLGLRRSECAYSMMSIRNKVMTPNVPSVLRKKKTASSFLFSTSNAAGR